MSDSLTITGQLAIVPDSTSDADLSGDFAIKVPLNATLTLSRKESVSVILADTTPVAVNVGSIVSIHALAIRTDEPITATITSASGSSQVIPIDSMLILLTETVPITAITLTAATTANVKMTMGRV